VLGHEVVGIVTQGARDGSGHPVGSRVAIHPGGTGGPEAVFPEGRANLSDRATYLGSAARLPHTAGAFADRVVLPSSMIRLVPKGLALRDAAVAEPASVAWHAVQRAGDVAERRVVVLGCGPIGALIVGVLARAGAAEIIAVDMHELPLGIARELGATRVVVGSETEVVASLQADIVFEASGSTRGLDSALRAARPGGRVVLVGLLPPGPQPVELSLAISRELDLIGCFRFVDELDDTLLALADGSLAGHAVVTHEFPLAEAATAFAVAADSATSGKVLLHFGA